MSSHLEIRIDTPNDGEDGTCRECGSFWYDNIDSEGYCPECNARAAHEDRLEDWAIMDRDDPIDFYQGDDE